MVRFLAVSGEKTSKFRKRGKLQPASRDLTKLVNACSFDLNFGNFSLEKAIFGHTYMIQTDMTSTKKTKVCLVCCSVLRGELELLKKQGRLDAELVFVSKNFHVDYGQLESNLRKVLEHTKKRFRGKIVLVYGDLCLGQNGEMKRLADEYGVVKVDADNCIDCQLGGKGRFSAADPDHNLMFMGPGMIAFFADMKENLKREGVDEAVFAGMFSGVRGIVLLDTCGGAEKCREAIKKSGMNLEVLETREIGSGNVLRVVLDAVERTSRIN